MTREKPELLIRLIAISPFVVMLIFVPSLSDPFNLPKLYFLSVLAIGASLAFMFTKRSVSRSNTFIQSLTVLYVAFMLTILFSGMGSEPNYLRSLLGSFSRNNGVIYYLAVSIMSIVCLRVAYRVNFSELSVKYLYFSGVVLVLYSLLQYMHLDLFEWNNPYNRIIGTFGNPNFSASALASFSVVYLFDFWNKFRCSKKIEFRSVMSLCLFALAGFLSWKTESLQGLVLVSIGISLLLLKFARDVAKNSIFVSAVILLFTLGTFVLSSFLGLGPLGDELRQYTLSLRLYYAKIGFKAMLENPLTGEGADRYLEAFLRLREPEFISEYGLSTVTDNAHSAPIQIGASFGVLAFLLYVAIFSLVFFFSFKCVVQRGFRRPNEQLISIFVLLMFTQSIISIEQLGLGVPLWILGASVLGNHFSSAEVQEKSRRQISLQDRNFASFMNTEFVVIVTVLFSIPFIYVSREDQVWKSIVYLKYTNVEDGTFIANQYNRLSDLTLSEPKKAGRLLENLYNSGDLEKVKNLVDRLFTQNPDDSYVHEIAATELASRGDLNGALLLYSKLMKLDPVNWKSWLRKGRLELDAGNKEEAIKSLLKVVELGPNSDEAEVARDLLSDLNS